MKIVVSHVYSSDNKGDAALVSVLLQDIKRKFANAEVTILTLEKIENNELYEGIPQKPSFMYYALTTYENKILKSLYSLFVTLATIIWAFIYRHFKIKLYLPKSLRNIAEVYAEADLILPVGGGYVRSGTSLTSTINLFLILHPLLFAYLLRKPTVLYTQSVGPFYRWIEKKSVSFVFKRMDLIILREEISRKLLASMGVVDNVVRSVDSGFLFKAKEPINIRKMYKIPNKGLLVGVTVRKWLDKNSQKQYETAIAHIIDYIIVKYKANVVFIPQVTAEFHGDDDRKASQDVYSMLQHKDSAYVVVDNLTHYDVKAMYDNLDFIIGTRFHSVIFSLTSYVPALAIEYEHKTSGIMNDLELSEWVIKIESIQPKELEKKIDMLFATKDEYVNHLHKKLPAYITQAEQAIELAADAYESSLTSDHR